MMSVKSYTLKNIKNFKAKDIFDCGQCFRWNEDVNGDYVGVVGNRVLRVCENGDGSVTFYGTDEKER
jgi:N-glycosylase/DNA lyase